VRDGRTDSITVIRRREWMEREKLPYPLPQIGLALVEAESRTSAVNGLFRSKLMWLGASMPMIIGSLQGLSRYTNAVTPARLNSSLALFGVIDVPIITNFSLVGFSYFINIQVAAGFSV
jgi:hypothetical protein